MYVMFQPLDPESIFRRIWRKITRNPRDEAVRVNINGDSYVINRGVPVDLPEHVIYSIFRCSCKSHRRITPYVEYQPNHRKDD